MSNPRIIGIVCIRCGIAVQSIGFKKFLPLGRPEVAVSFLDRWCADEIVIIDIGATQAGQTIDPGAIRTPIAVGGGINNLTQIEEIIRNGIGD